MHSLIRYCTFIYFLQFYFSVDRYFKKSGQFYISKIYVGICVTFSPLSSVSFLWHLGEDDSLGGGTGGERTCCCLDLKTNDPDFYVFSMFDKRN